MSDVLENKLPKGESLRVNEWSGTVVWIIAVGCGAIGIFGLVHQPHTTHGAGGGLRIIASLGFLLYALFMTRVALAGIAVNEDGIRVRTFWRTRNLIWAEISQFALRDVVYRPNLSIKMKDGSELRATGFAGRTPKERKTADALVAQLNDRLGSPSA